MSGPAEVRLAGRDGMFIASDVHIQPAFITATGCWRRRLATGDKFGELRTYTWSAREVREIRWHARAAA